MTKRYTIQDVAKAAGVGVGTVSRVLNDDPRVRSATRGRVQRTIERLGYQPSFAARSLRTQQSHVIGFVADAVATTPYAVEVIKGAQACAWENQKLLLVVDAGGDRRLQERALEVMLEREVEGLVYAAMFHQEVTLPEKFGALPTVLVDCYTADGRFAACVPDEVQGGFDATRQLLARGHQRIAIILNDVLASSYPAPKGRLEGYTRALTGAGIALDPDLVRVGDGEAASSFALTRDLMTLTKPPTAIFCCTDRMALGCYDALKSLGLRIPDDVSVIGFDNQKAIAEQLYPPLSTMALPHEAMGRWAVERLLNPVSDTARYALPCPFVERASIGRAA